MYIILTLIILNGIIIYIWWYQHNRQRCLANAASHYTHLWYLSDDNLIDMFIGYYYDVYIAECYSCKDVTYLILLQWEIDDRELNEQVDIRLTQLGVSVASPSSALLP